MNTFIHQVSWNLEGRGHSFLDIYICHCC